MPPHYRMSLTQQLLMPALVARIREQHYRTEMVHWNTTIHDRFMLPYFLWQDFRDVIEDTQAAGFDIQLEWFDAPV